MALYFKKIGGEWLVYGPSGEVHLGPATVTKRNGNTSEVVITELVRAARINGVMCMLARIESGEAKTYREKREEKAEKLGEWADKRQTTAEATLKADEVYTTDHAFNTQPGHIPIRERVIARGDRAFESLRTAEEMRQRAASIKAATSNAIYSDDHDAIQQLEARIASLEAERDRIKAYNASCRKGKRDVTLLDAKQQRDLASVAKHAAYQIRPDGSAPSYWAANLSSNIKRNRDRLARLKREQALLQGGNSGNESQES